MTCLLINESSRRQVRRSNFLILCESKDYLGLFKKCIESRMCRVEVRSNDISFSERYHRSVL
jgi:hypothetical protein